MKYLRDVRLPVGLEELTALRTRMKDIGSRLHHVLGGAQLMEPKVEVVHNFEKVAVSTHALTQLGARFRKYARLVTSANLADDLEKFVKTGYVHQAMTPSRHKDADEDWLICHDLPVWDHMQAVVAVVKSTPNVGFLVTLENSERGRAVRLEKVGEQLVETSPCEQKQTINSLIAQWWVVRHLEVTSSSSNAYWAVGSKFFVFEMASGARCWGVVAHNKEDGHVIVSAISAHTILDLILLHKKYKGALLTQMELLLGNYGLSTTKWEILKDLKGTHKAATMFGARVYPPDHETLDVLTLESLISRERNRTGEL